MSDEKIRELTVEELNKVAGGQVIGGGNPQDPTDPAYYTYWAHLSSGGSIGSGAGHPQPLQA